MPPIDVLLKRTSNARCERAEVMLLDGLDADLLVDLFTGGDISTISQEGKRLLS